MTPQEEIQVRQMMALQDAARFSGLLGNTPNPYARGLRPPTDAERARLDANSQVNPEMPLNDLARARLEAERPFNPGSTLYTPDNPNYYTGGTPLRPPETMEEARARARLEAERPFNPDDVYASFSPNTRYNPDGTPLPPIGGEMAADPEPEEYDGFVDSGTGQRGFMGDKYMPTPMDTSVAPASEADSEALEYFRRMGIRRADDTRPPPTYDRAYAQRLVEEYDRRNPQMGRMRGTNVANTEAASAPPVANTAYNAPLVASTAYNAPLVASTAYMPPPTAAPVNTAYMPPPTDAPVNTAYMPSRRTVPVDTTYRPPASANTTYMPSPSPSYGMSTTPTYNMSTSTTPTYGTSNGGQMREPSFSPNQAGKYKVDGPRLRNTGGLFNDLNAFFGRPQT